jgi:2-amino-4-hydroxy-6-hydroxymethyldihydropteridine diphosphokinase
LIQNARIFISLGANLGDPVAQIEDAIHRLSKREGFRISKLSSFFLTEPVGPINQPQYVNAVAELWSRLSPQEVLAGLLGVESDMGRERAVRWGPRRIDLDLLIYSGQICDEPGLKVPHPRMHERRFVLEPLAELASELSHPRYDQTIRELLDALPEDGPWVKRMDRSWEAIPASAP